MRLVSSLQILNLMMQAQAEKEQQQPARLIQALRPLIIPRLNYLSLLVLIPGLQLQEKDTISIYLSIYT